MDYHVAPDCAISHSIHSPVSRETYPVCKLADVGYCMERLEFTPIQPRTSTMWWSVEKKRKSIISPFSTSHLVPLSTMRGRVYIYIYILVSLPRADIIFAFLKLKRMQARVTNWFCFDVRNFPYLNWSFVSMNSQSTLECQVSIIDLISMKGLDRNSTITFYYPDFSRVRSPLLP